MCVALLGTSAHAAHGITVFGGLKYPAGFRHFSYVNPNAPKGGTLKLSASATFDSTNPFIIKGLAAPGITQYLFQSLMVPSYDEPQSYYGLIAQSIYLAPDRSYAEFVLNPKARWHDGTPITVEDVIWTLNTLKEKGHPLYRVTYAPIERAEKIGPRSVRFWFDDVEHRELPLIAASMPILPKHYYEKVPFEKTTLEPPLGSGPYKVSRIDPGRSITFRRVEDYWAKNLPTQRGLYNFDTIKIDVYRDDVVALEGIKSHQFDYYEEYIARNWATAYHTPAIKSGELIKVKIPNKIPRGMQGFMFNTRRDKFADPRVREAIGLTLDYEWMNKTLFYNAYERNKSYFQNNDLFQSTATPQGAELALLEQWKCPAAPSPREGAFNSSPRKGGGREGAASEPSSSSSAGSPHLTSPLAEGGTCLPSTLFTQPYTVPTTDGSGYARANVIKAQQLLDEAGWTMRDGKRTNEKTGEVMTIEFLMTQRTFERVIGIMRSNLKKLGINSSFRYVDASQYQRRVDKRNFDIVSIWWNLGLMFPGSEQYTYWHSSEADKLGSQNIGGVKNPIVDELVNRIKRAQTLEQLQPAAKALDRVLLWSNYVIPHWSINAWRVVYWNQFGRPKTTPPYNMCTECWWSDPKALQRSTPPQKQSSTSPLGEVKIALEQFWVRATGLTARTPSPKIVKNDFDLSQGRGKNFHESRTTNHESPKRSAT